MSLPAEVEAPKKTARLSCEVEVAAFSREVGAALAAIEKRTKIPILGYVLLSGDGDRLKISATDLEMFYVSEIQAKGASGEIALPAARLSNYLRVALPGTAKITTGKNQSATITIGKSKTRIAGLSSMSFPDLPAIEDPSITVTGASLSALIRRVALAISKEESRFTLNGAKVELSAGGLVAVGTDSHRLAWASLPFVAEGEVEKISRLVPARALAAIAKMFESDAKVEVVFAEKALVVRTEKRTLYARELTGNFPDYARVLPTWDGLKNRVECSATELNSAFARVKTTADERSMSCRVSISKEGVKLSSALSDIGDSSESIDAVVDGVPVEFGMNAVYLMNFLAAVGTDRVQLLYKDEKSALEMRPAGDAADYRYIVMPMRI